MSLPDYEENNQPTTTTSNTVTDQKSFPRFHNLVLAMLSSSPNNDTQSSEGTFLVDIVYYLQIIYILPIVFGNFLILFTYIHVRAIRGKLDNFPIALLAVADLLIGVVFIPITVAERVEPDFFQQSFFTCFLDGPLRIFIYSLTVSMLMLLTIDRYIAINCPFWYHAHMTLRKLVFGAGFIICIDIVIMIVYEYELIVNATVNNNLLMCSLTKVSDYFIYWLMSVFFIKILISCACTVMVVKTVFRSIKFERKMRSSSVTPLELTRHQKMKSDAKLTASLMCVFIVLLLPLIGIGVTAKDPDRTKRHIIRGIVFHSGLLNSSLNVVIYAVTRRTYRASFVFLLTNRPCKWKDVEAHTASRQSHLFPSMVTRYALKDNSEDYGSEQQNENSTTVELTKGSESEEFEVKLDFAELDVGKGSATSLVMSDSVKSVGLKDSVSGTSVRSVGLNNSVIKSSGSGTSVKSVVD